MCNDEDDKNKIPGSVLLSRSAHKVNKGLFWAEASPPSKFCGNPFIGYCVILLKNQPTNRL